MKKLLALLLVFAMLVCMAACGSTEKKDDDSKKEKATNETNDTVQDSDDLTSEENSDDTSELEQESEEETESETEEETEEETESETEEVTETESEEEVSAGGGILEGILGTHNGNSYENSFLGIGCELDSEWSVYDEEQIAAVLGIAADMISDEDISEAVEKSGSAAVFMATKSNGSSVGITVENSALYGAVLTEETFIELAVPMLETAMESAGLENLQISTKKVMFAGVEHSAIVIEGELYGMKLYEMMVPLVYETCIASVAVATYNENTCEDVLAAFYALPM